MCGLGKLCSLFVCLSNPGTSREPAKPGPPDGSFHACLTSFMARRQQRRGHSHVSTEGKLAYDLTSVTNYVSLVSVVFC
ncbi:hypothetical protein PR001_g8014 [Phytophthora rubi]|uniref:Secreted protein n=1 Tax=Phytophthora rubi TaxID=129364 RepID=A0A6A3MYN3_9STRA|nr:hypothetical protein PR002_g23798 [Phytophthora rubi]KAE9038295.1 hypothetical protein PR001_g8014 [Phytophthora rubi]